MCFRTTDDRAIHTTAQQLLSQVPKEKGGGTKLAMPRHTKKITAYMGDNVITGAIVGFDKTQKTILIKPIDAIDEDKHVVISFDTPAEKA